METYSFTEDNRGFGDRTGFPKHLNISTNAAEEGDSF